MNEFRSSGPSTIEANYEFTELCETVHSAFKTLSTYHQALLHYYYAYGLTFGIIAISTGYSETTTRIHTRRALATLRSKLK